MPWIPRLAHSTSARHSVWRTQLPRTHLRSFVLTPAALSLALSTWNMASHDASWPPSALSTPARSPRRGAATALTNAAGVVSGSERRTTNGACTNDSKLKRCAHVSQYSLCLAAVEGGSELGRLSPHIPRGAGTARRVDEGSAAVGGRRAGAVVEKDCVAMGSRVRAATCVAVLLSVKADVDAPRPASQNAIAAQRSYFSQVAAGRVSPGGLAMSEMV